MRKLMLMSVVWLFSSTGLQAATPVVDFGAIAKIELMLTEMKSQLEQMKKHYDEATAQTGYLSDQLKAIEGKNSFGGLYDSVNDQQYRSWAPDTLEQFSEMLEHGFNPGDLKDRYEYYQTLFPPIDSKKIDQKNPNSQQRDLYQYQEEWTKLNLSGFAQTFEAVNISFEKINKLLDEVDANETLKQSADFNNRLLGELAYLMQNLVQVQNFDLHIKTMLQQAELINRDEHARFFTFKKK